MPGTDSWKVWKAEFILRRNKGPKGQGVSYWRSHAKARRREYGRAYFPSIGTFIYYSM